MLDTASVSFSHHAVERWTERVRDVSADFAVAELPRLVPFATVEDRSGRSAPHGRDLFLVLGEFCFPLVRRSDETLLATTCLWKQPDQREKASRAAPRDKRNRRRAATPYRRPRHTDWTTEPNPTTFERN